MLDLSTKSESEDDQLMDIEDEAGGEPVPYVKCPKCG